MDRRKKEKKGGELVYAVCFCHDGPHQQVWSLSATPMWNELVFLLVTFLI